MKTNQCWTWFIVSTLGLISLMLAAFAQNFNFLFVVFLISLLLGMRIYQKSSSLRLLRKMFGASLFFFVFALGAFALFVAPLYYLSKISSGKCEKV